MYGTGIKLIMDVVPNHSSDLHEWFNKSVHRIEPYTDYYVWQNATGYDSDGKPLPPNNWVFFCICGTSYLLSMRTEWRAIFIATG